MFYKRSFWTCLGYITWFHLPFCLQYFLQQLRFSVSVDSIYMFWQLIELKINKFEIPSIIAMVGYYTIKLEKRLFFHHCDLRISMFIKWNCELCQVMLTWSIKSKKLVMVCFYWKIEFRQTVWSEYISRRVICMEWVFLSSLEHIFLC